MSSLSEKSMKVHGLAGENMNSSIITKLFQVELGNVHNKNQFMASTVSSLSNVFGLLSVYYLLII